MKPHIALARARSLVLRMGTTVTSPRNLMRVEGPNVTVDLRTKADAQMIADAGAATLALVLLGHKPCAAETAVVDAHTRGKVGAASLLATALWNLAIDAADRQSEQSAA